MLIFTHGNTRSFYAPEIMKGDSYERKEKISQIKELVSELNEHRHAYYNLNAPSITDKEYDQMFDTLKKLELETGVVLSNSPTQNVGYYRACLKNI